jgi:hypothetical protein
MVEHVYKAKFYSVNGSSVVLDIDLGFNIMHRHTFWLYGVARADHLLAHQFIKDELEKAEEIFVHSIRQPWGQYVGDITYRFGQNDWRNLTKTLIDNKYVEGTPKDASE